MTDDVATDADAFTLPANADPAVVERIRSYVEYHPWEDSIDVVAELLVAPDVYLPVVEAAKDGALPESDRLEGESPASNPGGETSETEGESGPVGECDTRENLDLSDSGETDESHINEPDEGRKSTGTGPDNGVSLGECEKPAKPAGNEKGERPAHLRAFADAIDWYHEQLDRPIWPDDVDAADDAPATAREYFEDGRGWTPETVDAKRLGWAPATGTGLLDHLMRRGYDREAILGTGLFYEDLTPHFRGRYVFPYADADGRPVYAISRSIDDANGGHPNDHKGGDKYTKALLTADYSRVDEPIYGVDSLQPGEPALITEGMADAITAHQAGYPCLSPVTKEFKKSDRPKLVDILTAHDVPRVYVLQDAERPGADVRDGVEGWRSLSIHQFGEGIRGAVHTAAHLADNGVDARLAELPRPGLDKVDLDDYLQGWADTLTPVLASAKPAAQHPAYDPKDAAIDAAVSSARRAGDADDRDHGSGGAGGSGTASALFDLDIRDVTGLDWDYRGASPLGHHGESTNYFVLIRDHGVAFDHKFKSAYNALTYLLCDAGERDPAAPNGALSDREMFAAWRHAKAEGLIPTDDPVPHAALRFVAIDAGLCGTDDVEDGWRLPTRAYNGALDAIRGEYDVDPGREHIRAGYDPDADPEAVSALPLAQLAALDPVEQRRAAEKRGLHIPTGSEVWDRINDTLRDAFRDERATILDAPTSAGKSHAAAATPWTTLPDVTGDQPVVMLSPTKPARDQNIKKSRDADDVTCRVLKGRTDACPVARGTHDPETVEDADEDRQIITIGGEPGSKWLTRQCEQKGVPVSVAHAYLDEHNDQGAPLPCCPPTDDGGREKCESQAQWAGIPRGDDGDLAADVIHATHNFAMVPSLRQSTNVIFDEEPDFESGLGQDRIQRAIAAYLKALDAPVTTWEGFVGLAGAAYDTDAGKEADALRHSLGETPPREWYLRKRDAHTLAPALARALWYALRDDPDANGRRTATVPHEPPRLDAGANDDAGWNRVWVSVVVDDDNRIQKVRESPDLSQARAVVGLDARPGVYKWQRNTRPDIGVTRVLDPDERRLWRRFEQQKTVIQVGDATRPLTSGEYFDDDGMETILSHLREQYGDRFRSVITANSVEGRTKQLMGDVGIDDARTMHYNEEKSRDDFGAEDVGLINGCIDPGDDFVLDLLAEHGLDAQAARARRDTDCTHCENTGEACGDPDCKACEDGVCGACTCEDCHGAGCGECNGTGLKRAHGRGFVGPDADAADAILASVRENHVAQAVGRYAREPDGTGAVVFVRTNALPPDLPDYAVPGVQWVYGEKQRAVTAYLREHPGATAREIADGVDADVSKEHVRQTLARHRDRGVATVRRGAGAYGADTYAWAGPAAGADAGVADLSPEEITNRDVWDSYTWELAIESLQTRAPTRSSVPSGDDVNLATGDVRLTAFIDDPPPG